MSVGYNRRFDNERGSRITLDIEHHDADVRIFLSGPASDSVQRITRKEAEELRDGLSVVLGLNK